MLNPPPPSFERPRAANVPYTPFEPTSLLGISTDLTRSFPRMAPPCANAAEHPFATHDVAEAARLGFKVAVVPRGRALQGERGIPSRRVVDGLTVVEVDDVFGALLTLELTPPL